jgi:hypothetical protein|tara:strand:- start:800 stop:1177 length:378 start_codon:yes stop_codon:yes gene_type:complete
MSHFTCIKTKLKERPFLIDALKELDYNVQENHLLINPEDHNHKQWNVEVAISDEIGFKWNGKEYELVAELDAWDLDVPVSRFIEKVTQQYARATLLDAAKNEGYTIAEEKTSVTNDIEVVVTRWD